MIIIFLICLCLIFIIVLYKDNGSFKKKISTAKLIASNQGLGGMLKQAAINVSSKAVGKVKRVIAHFRRTSNDKSLSIAFLPSGGFGDYIISAKVLEEIIDKIITDGNSKGAAIERITVFSDKEAFARSIYSSYPNVEFKPDSKYYSENVSYDLAVKVEHLVYVNHVDFPRLDQLSPSLSASIRYITDHWNEFDLDIADQCFRERIWFERCRVEKLDRWTELRMDKAFQIADKKITLPIDEKFRANAEELVPQKYITINYGADQMRKGAKQLKVWLPEHYKEFIKLFHQAYPGIKVVQLGSADGEKLEGADRYVLGENLETVKWILKGSLVHVDSEGGLVHLAHQLDTRCVVMFGPTPVHMYGYEENINIVPSTCNNCMGTHMDWAYKCLRERDARGEREYPLCMRSIAPDQVLKAVKEVISQQKK
jgi:hypothetical protein